MITETRQLPHGLSVSMSLYQELDITQHAVNDKFFDNVWNMLKDGGVYVAPNGSTPIMKKNQRNKCWDIAFPSERPSANLWRRIGNG